MGELDGLFQIFLLIFLIGSSAASWFKKRREEEQRSAERDVDPGPVELVFEEDFLEEPPAPVVFPRLPMHPPPPPLSRRAGVPQAVGDLRSTLSQHVSGDSSFGHSLGEAFETGEISSLIGELEGRQLGELEASAAAELEQAQAWQASSSWREAVILRELLGTPLALREPGQPGLPS